MTRGRKHVGALVAFVATVTIGAVMVALPGSAGAGGPTSLVVTTLEDDLSYESTDGACDDGPDGTCSLREAVAVLQFHSGGTITFGVDGVFMLDQDIVLESNNAVVIQGNGVGETILDVAGIQAKGFRGIGGAFRHFVIENGADLTLTDMTLRNGSARDGGSVYVSYVGSLTTEDVHFLDNRASNRGGAIYADADNETVDIRSTTFAGNIAAYGGGAVWVGDDTATVVNSTFTGNEAPYGAAIGVSFRGTLSVDWSTFSQNTTTQEVQDTQVQGFRGVRSSAAAPSGGQGGEASTIYAEELRAQRFRGDFPVADVTISHSILEKTTGVSTDECGGAPMTSGGANIVDDDSCGFSEALDVEGVAANVGALGDNGGATFTMALTVASAAVDVDPALCKLNDQRDLPRNVDGDEDGTAACDSGAYELQVTPVDPTTSTTTTTSPDGDVDADTATAATPTVAQPTFTG